MAHVHHESRPPSLAATEPEDLISGPHSLHRAVRARRSEYVRPHRIRIKVATWNVAASPGTDKDLASWFVEGEGVDKSIATLSPLSHNPAVVEGVDPSRSPETDPDPDPTAVRLVGGDKIGLYVLGLQEVVDLGPSQYLNRVVAEDPTMEKWKAALEAALPDGYQLVSCEQMSGLLLLIYASPEVASTVGNVSSCSIGTGMMGGWIGNKGAVATRIVLGEATKMGFINCHLASGHDTAACERRVWDVGQISSRTKFAPVSYAGVSEEDSDTIDAQDFAFWFGDLNFRLDGLPGDDIRRLLMLHTRGEYDLSRKGEPGRPEGEGVVVQVSSESSDDGTDRDSVTTGWTEPSFDDSSVSLPDPDDFESSPHEDPASLQATLDSLLPHDQLRRMMRERKAFHDGWREGTITFLPTYKYDVGTVSLFDSSDKRRAPSWCDRILYRTRTDTERHKQKVKEEEDARRRDEEMKARGMDHAGDDDEVLFDYDPDSDGDAHPLGKAVFDYDEYDEYDEDQAGGQAPTAEGLLDRIQADIYTSHQRIMSSDHKPIVSIFSIDYDAVVPELRARVHAEVARELDRAENEGRPVITLVIDGHELARPSQGSDSESSSHAVDFGEIRFLRKETASLTLANTGGVAARFSFVEKPTTEEESGEPRPVPWLTTSFAHPDEEIDASEFGGEVVLEPGETARAFLEAYVGDATHARMLNDGQANLEDVLVLRVTDGRDHFIPVRAVWSPTCIGRSIDELIRVPNGGLRAFIASRSKNNNNDDHMGSIPYDLDVHFAAPKELFKLTEAVESLTERALADELMLEEHQVPKDPGWPLAEKSWKYTDKEARRTHSMRIIDALDSDRPIVDAFDPETPSVERLEAVSEVLLLFLASLTDGVVTIPLWARIEQAPLAVLGQAGSGNPASKQPAEEAAEDDKTAVLDVLSSAPNHNISFVFLASTLAKTISELAPLSRADLECLKSVPGQGLGSLGRRSLVFRRGGTALGAAAAAAAALERRQAKERRFAEILGKMVCRAVVPGKDRERRSLEDRQRAVMELFLKRREDG